MRIVAFRGEASVEAIADKVFVDLSAKDRRKAVTELLRANPQLEDLDALAPATLIRVPSIPKLHPRDGRGLDDPARAVVKQVQESIAQYGKRLAERHEGYEAQLKDQAKLLRDRELKKLSGDSPALAELVAAATKETAAQTKLVMERRERVEAAVEKLREDLG